MSGAREPWDLERFVERYDAVADELKGWRFERTPDRVEAARKDYLRGGYADLCEFARARFEWEQRT